MTMAMSLRRLSVLAAALVPAHALYINGSVVAPCDSPIYCYGDILKEVELARPFSDSKTFVDMPAVKSLEEIIAAFNKLQKPLSNNSALNAFLTENFAPAGGELNEVPAAELHTNPKFLDAVNDTVIREFTSKVIDIWPNLTRTYAGAGACSECPNSFIPVNRTFVVAGGRFREPYYWDSYWILEGLLRTGGAFVEISRNTIENFLDFVEQFGFVPNGARLYYLNRSQPPMLSQMVKLYVEHTGDDSILERAVPLLIKEHEFWMTNRTVEVKKHGKTYILNQYNVENTEPRPESYREDYITANNASYYSQTGEIFPAAEKLNKTQIANVYRNLASGAESGWDYGTRYLSRPLDAARDTSFPLRYLNVVGTVPLDLNSILYANEVAISGFLNRTGDCDGAEEWAAVAEKRSDAMYAVMWNDKLYSYFDYNLTSGEQAKFVPLDDTALDVDTKGAPEGMQVLFSAAQLYPFWTGAAPAHLKNNPKAVLRAYRKVEAYLDARAGGIPATNFRTGQQWDEPNVWPPLMHILMAGLVATPEPRTHHHSNPPSQTPTRALAARLAQRYLDSTFCTWYATGGSTSETPQLAGLVAADVGTMFEKYADNATNVVGGGGEYEVVEGFGWTNGVLIYVVDEFSSELVRPDCGNIRAADVNHGSKRSLPQRAVELSPWDAKFVKKFGRRALMG